MSGFLGEKSSRVFFINIFYSNFFYRRKLGKLNYAKLPILAKIENYDNFKGDGLKLTSLKKEKKIVILVDAGIQRYAIAEPINLRNREQNISKGNIFLLSESFNGYFEILSENGNTVGIYENIFEISKRQNTKFLVRESFSISEMNSAMTLKSGDVLETLETPISNDKKLRCRDLNNQLISIPLIDRELRFSPIISPKNEDISGVHSVS